MSPRAQRRRLPTALLGICTAIALFSATQHIGSTLAAWNDSEWVTSSPGSLSTLDCTSPIPDNQVATQAKGQFLSGTALGLDLGNLLELSGVHVTNNGVRAAVTPATAQPHPDTPDTFFNPLQLSVLQIPLPNLAPPLQIPLNTSAGAAGQFASAQSTGESHAASGLITNSGGISLSAEATAHPDVATINLSQLLNAVGLNLGTLVSGVADVSMKVGAVASTAKIRGCDQLWAPNNIQNIERNYHIAGLQTQITSPAVGSLLTGLTSLVTNLNTTATNIQNNQAVKQLILNGVTGLLNSVLNNSILGLASINISSLSTEIDTSSLTTFLAAPIQDSNGVLTIHPTAGTVTVNTAALFGQTYPAQISSHLNGLDPNTNILSDPNALITLNTALSTTLSNWISEITRQLNSIVSSALVKASLVINLEVDLGLTQVQIGSVTAQVQGSLSNLLAGTVPATITTNLNLGILSSTVAAIINPTLTLLLSTLTSGLGAIVGTAVNSVLNVYRAVDSTTAALTNPIILAVSNLYNSLFISGIVSASVNAQNDPLSGSAEPNEWSPIPQGQFDISAIRIGVLNVAQQQSIALHLARSSVGQVCPAQRLTGQCLNY